MFRCAPHQQVKNALGTRVLKNGIEMNMRLISVDAENFGPFHSKRLMFSDSNLSVILGPNCSGKTQLAGAILFGLFGRKYVELRREIKQDSSVLLSISDSDKIHSIGHGYSSTDGFYKIPKEEVFVKTLHECIAFDLMPSFCMSQGMQSQISFESLPTDNSTFDFLRNHAGYKTVMDIIHNQNSAGSESQIILLRFINEYLHRKKSSYRFPLIVDIEFNLLSIEAIEIIWLLIKEISTLNQVIIFTAHMDFIKKFSLESSVVEQLSFIKKSETSPVGFNSFANVKPRYSHKKRVANRNNRLLKGLKWKSDENIYTEFKEVKGNAPVNSIKNIADQYIVAFLNSPEKRPGSIFWGIRDKDKSVVGVFLEYEHRDQLRKALINKLHDIQPVIPLTNYRVIFHEVYENDKPCDNLYVVEVSVIPVKELFLFSTGKNEVYIKTDSGKKKLTSYELQMEVLKRFESAEVPNNLLLVPR